MTQKIVPHLWFDTQAKEAAAFYTTVFPDAKITQSTVIQGSPSGDCDVISFDILGYSFQSISAGPYFKINPSISFMVNFDPSQHPDAREQIDAVWNKLIEGGNIMMPLDAYPFSERYGWVEDKYGVSWQLIYTKPEGDERPLVMPALMFTKDQYGKAIEATDFYMSIFKDSKRGAIAPYGPDQAPNDPNAVMFTDFTLAGQWFVAMDGLGTHGFQFNEGVSLMVKCETQEEIDHFWNTLSAVPEAEQCGWLTDKYGISWQIVPAAMDDMMACGDQEKINKVTQAFLQMKKFDIAKLEEAFNS